MKTLVYIETKNGKPQNSSLELLSAANALGDGIAVLTGKECGELAREISGYGVDVWHLNGEAACQDERLAMLESAALQTDCDLILFGATQEGKDLAPRLAARLNTGCVTDAVEIRQEADGIVMVRPAYGGTVLETMQFVQQGKAVATVRGGSFGKPEVSERAGQVTEKDVTVPETAVRARLTETTVEITELVNLEGADVIVAGGRGCGDKATFALVEELAGLLGGVAGASRPAIEAGWVSRAHQVGQSGKNVAPRLYIACGISGAMQHISGITGSDYIVAINKDEDAPIFEIADMGIVGKCEEILPLMIEEIRKRKT